MMPEDAVLDERIEEFGQLGILTGERLALLVEWDTAALRRAFGRHTQRLAEYRAEADAKEVMLRTRGESARWDANHFNDVVRRNRFGEVKYEDDFKQLGALQSAASKAESESGSFQAERKNRIADLTLRQEAVGDALRLCIDRELVKADDRPWASEASEEDPR